MADAPEARTTRTDGTTPARRSRRRTSSAKNEAKPATQATTTRRRRTTSNHRRHRRATKPEEPKEAEVAAAEEKPEATTARRKRTTTARKKKDDSKAKASTTTKAKPKRTTTTRTRRKPKAPEPPEAYDDVLPESSAVPAPSRQQVPVTGAPTDEVPAPFAHNAEYEFASILDFYGIEWVYEPRSFPLRWEKGHVTEAFTPDFYLPERDLYVELTTLKSSLTAEKNRKMRQIKELYPDTKIIMLKKRDYLRLLANYGYGPLSPEQVPDVERVMISQARIASRVQELGAEISRDYADKEPVLVGVLRGVICFMADLMRNLSVPCNTDFMAVSSYAGSHAGAVRIQKDLDLNIKGRDVIIVEDIVDTGMTLNHLVEYLQTKRPASVKICALLDKRARRLIDVPLDYVGFEIEDEFVVGYGLDFHQRFRNLPFIGTLKHELLP
jgi:hypoxanthine phosphoribosyltransferase